MTRTRLKKKQRRKRRLACSSKKAAFPDKIAAELFLATHKDRVGLKPLKRSYLCPECHKWHLTSSS